MVRHPSVKFVLGFVATMGGLLLYGYIRRNSAVLEMQVCLVVLWLNFVYVFKPDILDICCTKNIHNSVNLQYHIYSSSCYSGFLRRFRDTIQVPRITENYHRVPKIRENRVSRIRENQVSRIRDIGSLHIHTGHLTFSLKKPVLLMIFLRKSLDLIFVQPKFKHALLPE